MATRINKYLSEVGFCSRRAADKLIEQGRVRINGQVPEMGTKVQPGDVITVDDEPIGAPQEEFIYIAFNKPVGIVCTTDHIREKDNIIDYINHPKRIFPIGRLDKPSEGLIFLHFEGGPQGGSQVASFNLAWLLKGESTGDGTIPGDLK